MGVGVVSCAMATTTTKYANSIREHLLAKRAHYGIPLITVSAAMAERGSPMPTIALRRFEEGTRKLTVDEAMALLDFLQIPFETIASKVVGA